MPSIPAEMGLDPKEGMLHVRTLCLFRQTLPVWVSEIGFCVLAALAAACSFDVSRLRAQPVQSTGGSTDPTPADANSDDVPTDAPSSGSGGSLGTGGTAGMPGTSTTTVTGTATTTLTSTTTLTATATSTGTATKPDASVDTGPAPVGMLKISVSALNFGNNGNVACKATPAPAAPLSLVLSNVGNQSLGWTAALGRSPSPFGIVPASGILSALGTPGASVTVVVTPSAIPFPADTTVNAYGDTLSITTTIATDVVHSIKLNQTAQGAVLSYQPADPYDFGNVRVGSTASASIQLANTGNASVDVTLNASRLSGQPEAIFTVNAGASALLTGVAAGTTRTLNLGFAPGGLSTDATSATGTLTASVGANAVLCSALPEALLLTGAGSMAWVVANPSSQVYFTGPGMTQSGTVFSVPARGFTYCGTTASPQTIAFTNTGTAGYTITAASFDQGTTSPYSVSIGNNGDGVGVVNPNKSVLVTITSAAVPSNWNFATPSGSFGDTLTVTTTAVGDLPHAFTISQSPYGAVLQNFTPSPNGTIAALNFPSTVGGGQSSIPMGLANAGNAPATVGFAITSNGNAPGGTWSFDTATLAPFSSLPDGVTSFSAFFNPPVVTSNVSYSGGVASFALTKTPLCTTTLPVATAAIKGTGTNTQPITVTPTSIVFKAIPCGPSAPGGVNSTVTIKNASSSRVTWTASIPPDPVDKTSFILSASSGSIGANSTGTFTLSPAPIPTDSDVVPPSTGPEYSSVLTVTVGSSNPFTIPVTEIASGLFLKLPASVNSFHPTSGVQFTSQTFLLKNMGDIGANITLALGSDSPALLRLNTQKQQPGTSKITSYIDHASSSGGATVTDYIINVSTNGQRGTELVTASAPGSTPLCWPMPTMSVVGQ